MGLGVCFEVQSGRFEGGVQWRVWNECQTPPSISYGLQEQVVCQYWQLILQAVWCSKVRYSGRFLCAPAGANALIHKET